jgi:hypothetical protein
LLLFLGRRFRGDLANFKYISVANARCDRLITPLSWLKHKSLGSFYRCLVKAVADRLHRDRVGDAPVRPDGDFELDRGFEPYCARGLGIGRFDELEQPRRGNLGLNRLGRGFFFSPWVGLGGGFGLLFRPAIRRLRLEQAGRYNHG